MSFKILRFIFNKILIFNILSVFFISNKLYSNDFLLKKNNPTKLAILYYNQAYKFYQEHKYNYSIRYLYECINLKYNNSKVYYYLAMSYLKNNNATMTMKYLRLYKKMDPNFQDIKEYQYLKAFQEYKELYQNNDKPYKSYFDYLIQIKLYIKLYNITIILIVLLTIIFAIFYMVFTYKISYKLDSIRNFIYFLNVDLIKSKESLDFLKLKESNYIGEKYKFVKKKVNQYECFINSFEYRCLLLNDSFERLKINYFIVFNFLISNNISDLEKDLYDLQDSIRKINYSIENEAF